MSKTQGQNYPPSVYLYFTEQTNDYTLALSDANRGVNMNKATANTLTVPANASVAFPIGVQIAIEQGGAGVTTIAPSGGVTIEANSLMMGGQYSVAVLVKKATNTWLLTTGNETIPVIITPSSITSDQDNYNPTNFANATIVRLSGDSSIRAITSFAAQSDGNTKRLVNVGSNPVYFPGEHPDGTAANRITVPHDVFLFPNQSIDMWYDGTTSRWIIDDADFRQDVAIGSYYHGIPGSGTLPDNFMVTWVAVNAGSGNTVAASNATYPSSTFILSTGVNTNGGAYVYLPKNILYFAAYGSSHEFFEGYVFVTTLSDGTDTYQLEFQITTTINSTLTNNNTIGFRYTHSLNSGNWSAFSKDNAGAESTVVDLGVNVVVDTRYKLRIEIDKALSEARFYINGAYKGRVTTNLPTAANVNGCRMMILKSAGTNSRSAYTGYLKAATIYS